MPSVFPFANAMPVTVATGGVTTTGYVSAADNKTYMAGGARPSDGSVVKTSTGTYAMVGGSGVSVSTLPVVYKSTNAVAAPAGNGAAINFYMPGPAYSDWDVIKNGVVSLSAGYVDGTAEAWSLGVGDLGMSRMSQNEAAYLLGKIVGNLTAMGMGLQLTEASAGFTVVTSETVVGAAVGSAAVAASATVVASGFSHAGRNIAEYAAIGKGGAEGKSTGGAGNRI